MSEAPSTLLQDLARACGVSTEFWDWQGRHTVVSAETIRAVLRALDIEAPDDETAAKALREVQRRPWRRVLPPVVVLRQGWTPWVPVHLPHGHGVSVRIVLEDGSSRDVKQVDHWVPPRMIDGQEVGEATVELPDDLPLGWHTLIARYDGTEATCPVVVTPHRLELPERLSRGRCWGLMAQIYSVRSTNSWGIGDLADLGEVASWGGDVGADFVLVNPLHAAEPVTPMEPSPYLPTTRRFANPVYIRVEDIPEVAYLDPAERKQVAGLAKKARALDTSDTVDRDAVWRLKVGALRIVHAAPRSPRRDRELDRYIATEGQGLVDFATWCALVAYHGLDATTWPAGLDDPAGEQVAAFREEAARDIHFYAWMQWVLDDQLRAAQASARRAGMGVGVIHDLAVGVHPTGADAWGLSSVLAQGVTVGAPADQYNQLGQDWSQPPWRPDRLAETGYAPYRDMLRTVLRHAGGIRVDHVLGLFRLWWVPAGLPASAGAYVRYDHEALVGILALEAQRAGAVVIGEDLGTVEPWVRDYLRARGILGTSILWFERNFAGGGEPLPPESYRELCLATVTTHDLPPTLGYLEGVHIDIRHQLGLLTRSLDEERATDAAEQAGVLAELRHRGLLDSAHPTPQDVVVALHRFLGQTASLLLGLSLPDLTGDRRPMNQPGTDEEYPNWRLPLADSDGRPVLLEDLMRLPFARTMAEAVRPQ